MKRMNETNYKRYTVWKGFGISGKEAAVASLLRRAHYGVRSEHYYLKNYPPISVRQELLDIIETIFSVGFSTIPPMTNDRKAIGEMSCTLLPKRLPREEMEKHYAVS